MTRHFIVHHQKWLHAEFQIRGKLSPDKGRPFFEANQAISSFHPSFLITFEFHSNPYPEPTIP